MDTALTAWTDGMSVPLAVLVWLLVVVTAGIIVLNVITFVAAWRYHSKAKHKAEAFAKRFDQERFEDRLK